MLGLTTYQRLWRDGRRGIMYLSSGLREVRGLEFLQARRSEETDVRTAGRDVCAGQIWRDERHDDRA